MVETMFLQFTSCVCCSKTVTRAGSEFAINNDAGNQMNVVTGFNAGKYLVIVNTGFSRGSSRGVWAMDIYGVFVTHRNDVLQGHGIPCSFFDKTKKKRQSIV